MDEHDDGGGPDEQLEHAVHHALRHRQRHQEAEGEDGGHREHGVEEGAPQLGSLRAPTARMHQPKPPRISHARTSPRTHVTNRTREDAESGALYGSPDSSESCG